MSPLLDSDKNVEKKLEHTQPAVESIGNKFLIL